MSGAASPPCETSHPQVGWQQLGLQRLQAKIRSSRVGRRGLQQAVAQGSTPHFGSGFTQQPTTLSAHPLWSQPQTSTGGGQYFLGECRPLSKLGRLAQQVGAGSQQTGAGAAHFGSQHFSAHPTFPLVPNRRSKSSKPNDWLVKLNPSTRVLTINVHFIEPCLLFDGTIELAPLLPVVVPIASPRFPPPKSIQVMMVGTGLGPVHRRLHRHVGSLRERVGLTGPLW
jgi:hypothetical protein